MTVERVIRVSVAVVGCTSLLSCAPRADGDSLVGRYQVRYPFGREQWVSRNGTYQQQVEVDPAPGRPSETLTNNGRWTVQLGRKAWGDLVRLERCLAVNDGVGGLRPEYRQSLPGGCSLPISPRALFFGRLSLATRDSFPLVKQE